MKKASGKKPTAATKRKLATTDQSLSSSVARSALSVLAIKSLGKEGERALAPLLKSKFADLTVKRLAKPTKSRAAAARTSDVADVTPVELREIAQLGEVGQIRANRRHRGG